MEKAGIRFKWQVWTEKSCGKSWLKMKWLKKKQLELQKSGFNNILLAFCILYICAFLFAFSRRHNTDPFSSYFWQGVTQTCLVGLCVYTVFSGIHRFVGELCVRFTCVCQKFIFVVVFPPAICHTQWKHISGNNKTNKEKKSRGNEFVVRFHLHWYKKKRSAFFSFEKFFVGIDGKKWLYEWKESVRKMFLCFLSFRMSFLFTSLRKKLKWRKINAHTHMWLIPQQIYTYTENVWIWHTWNCSNKITISAVSVLCVYFICISKQTACSNIRCHATLAFSYCYLPYIFENCENNITDRHTRLNVCINCLLPHTYTHTCTSYLRLFFTRLFI